jgi:flagellar FliJ protein
MQFLAGVAKNSEHKAARTLAEKQQQLQQQRDRLQELLSYREEYAVKFQKHGSVGLDVRRLNEYRSFLEKLNLAIEQQRQRINQVSGECHVYQEHWVTTRIHSKAVDKVVDRFQRQDLREEDSREQNELDERAQQLGLTRPKG